MMMIPDELYKSEVSQIVYIQEKLQFFEKFLEMISETIHPSIFLLYVIPLLSAFRPSTYFRLLTTVITTEYMVLLLKWMFSACRPYWWVHETNVYKEDRPVLRQARITCEPTSGLPSAHVLFASSILYVMIRELFAELNERKIKNRYITSGIWCVYGLTILLVTLSRMYFACHFLHQCLCGILVGIVIAEVIGDDELQSKLVNLDTKRALWYAAELCSGIVTFFLLKKLVARDSEWAVQMTSKWCANPLFVKSIRHPMIRMSRDFGIIFGLAVSLPLNLSFQTELNYKKSFSVVAACVIVFRVINYYLVPAHIGFAGSLILTFGINLLFPYLYIVIVPKLCRRSENE